MKTAILSVGLTGEEQKKAAKRYHFDEAGLARIKILYEAVLPLLRPQVCYAVRKRSVCCAVTLGEGIDLLQELYGQAGAVTDVYILECIGSSLLEKAYEQVDRLIFQETGLFLQSRVFPGSEIPLTEMQEILQNLSPLVEKLSISCNSYFSLSPKKSVVFAAKLGEKKQDCSICATCSRTDCENRRVSENYSYGYQRIFGKI